MMRRKTNSGWQKVVAHNRPDRSKNEMQQKAQKTRKKRENDKQTRSARSHCCTCACACACACVSVCCVCRVETEPTDFTHAPSVSVSERVRPTHPSRQPPRHVINCCCRWYSLSFRVSTKYSTDEMGKVLPLLCPDFSEFAVLTYV